MGARVQELLVEGVERHGALGIAQRKLVLFGLKVDARAGFEGPAMPGIDLDRLAEVGDGLIVLLPALVGDAAVVVGGGVRRIDLDDTGVVGDGAVEMALARLGEAAVEEGRGVSGKLADAVGAAVDAAVNVLRLLAVLSGPACAATACQSNIKMAVIHIGM